MPEDKVAWDELFEGYMPVEYVDPAVLANDSEQRAGGWADPPAVDRKSFERERISYELEAVGEKWGWHEGRPLNPRGRTGMCERGLLGKWGANHCADPVVTRYNPYKPGRVLEMIAVKRAGGSYGFGGGDEHWAIPGGMCEPNVQVSTRVRQKLEEAAGGLEAEEKGRFETLCEELLSEVR